MSKTRAYINGFLLSILLTLVAFGLAQEHLQTGHVFPAHEVLLPIFIGLAIIQLIVQLVFFLHVGREDKPKWNAVALLFALFIVFVLVGGTLWIMNNLQQSQMQNSDVFSQENMYPPAK